MKTRLWAWASWIAFLVSAVGEWGYDTDLPLTPVLWLIVATGTLFATTTHAALTTNDWKGSTSGVWWDTNLWSLGVLPSNSQSAVVITNGFILSQTSKTVTIDTTAATNFPGSMTISNLIVGGSSDGVGGPPNIGTNVLLLSNIGTTALHILNSLSISNGGAVRVTNSVLLVNGPGGVQDDGEIRLDSGSIVFSNVVGSILTVGNKAPGTLIISNGTLICPSLDIGRTNASSATVRLAGGTLSLMVGTGFGYMRVGIDAGVTAAVWITGGTLGGSNSQIDVGSGSDATEHGVGFLTQSNGVVLIDIELIGATFGSVGTLTVAGGSHFITGNGCAVGNEPSATGTVWLTGGQLICSNGFINLGDFGTGRMTVSNGVCYTRTLGVGVGSDGTLTVAGGTVTIASTNPVFTPELSVGNSSTGTMSMTGGQMITTGAVTTVGNSGVGRLIMSNGTWHASDVLVAVGSGGVGTLTAVGGTTFISSNLVIGDCALGAVGNVFVQGGGVFVTNSSHTATVDVRDALLSLTAGQLVIDRLVITNTCGHFFHGGGTLTVSTVVLDPNLDADGDGLPNGWEQLHGLNPLESSGVDGADGDPDHDGFTNLEEYQAGTDPQDFNSTPLRITSIVKQGNDVLLTWITATGKTNLLQFTKGTAVGSYSNNFTDLSPVIIPTGVGLTSTNYLDTGGATNFPSRYYRVRLVP